MTAKRYLLIRWKPLCFHMYHVAVLCVCAYADAHS